MKIIHFIKIHNFKVFGEEQTIELDQPSVLIGPNNSGKTTVLQALALWSIGVKKWYGIKGASKSTKNVTTGINRLEIIQVPVQEAKYFWKNTIIRKGSTNYLPLKITVGIEFKGKVEECCLSFTHYTPEVIYCQPDESTIVNKELLEYASSINIEILYPMSGITTEETLLPEGRINVLVGEGKTAEVLRNLCYHIWENDKEKGTEYWKEITELNRRLFHIDLLEPQFNKTRGSIELKYKKEDIKSPLDIALSGRGQQQILLLIAYIYAHRKSIILLDEPDAHLEILRQRQIFTLLRNLADKNDNQIIIATHSEVILDEASDNNLVMILDGNPINIAKKTDIRSALKNIGIEHYYKAKRNKSIIYVEGSTDLEMLRSFAFLLNHPTKDIFNGVINYYYTQDNDSIDTPLNQLERIGKVIESHKKHFYALKAVVSDFKGFAIFDSDNRNMVNEINDDLATLYWKRYELENYFIYPEVILNYVRVHYEKQQVEPLFLQPKLDEFKSVLDNKILKFVFNNNKEAFMDFNNVPNSLKTVLWVNLTKNLKMSLFLEEVLETYSKKYNQPILLNKGQFYELIEFLPLDRVDDEIKEVFNLQMQYFRNS